MSNDVLIENFEGIQGVSIQGDEVVIESIEDYNDVNIEGLIQGIENEDDVNIEGFFSFIKKAVRKVASVGRIASKFGLMPPGASFGFSMLSKLASSSRTRRRVKFSAGATKNVYQVAYLKGYAKGLKQVERYARMKRR